MQVSSDELMMLVASYAEALAKQARADWSGDDAFIEDLRDIAARFAEISAELDLRSKAKPASGAKQ